MKIIKELHTEFGDVYFLNASYATDPTLVAVLVKQNRHFQAGIISTEVFKEIKSQSDEDMIFQFPYHDPDYSDFITGEVNADGSFILSDSGSIGQEDFELPLVKMEIIALTIALELVLKVPNVFKPFTLNYERVTDAYINKKVLLNDTGLSFTSGFSGKTYSFALDPKYAHWDDIHNWLVFCEGVQENQVWIAPIKCYITQSNRDEDFTSLEELWDSWLIKQYAVHLSLKHLPESWVTQGYHKLLATYLDEVIYA